MPLIASISSSCSVKLRHDGDFSRISVYIAAPIGILKFIHFKQYPLSRALSAEAIVWSSVSAAIRLM